MADDAEEKSPPQDWSVEFAAILLVGGFLASLLLMPGAERLALFPLFLSIVLCVATAARAWKKQIRVSWLHLIIVLILDVGLLVMLVKYLLS